MTTVVFYHHRINLKGVLSMTNNVILPIVLAAAAVLVVVLIRAKKQEKHYDERQLLARNAAFKTAFFTLVSACFICGFLDLLDIHWAEASIQMFLIALLAITVFVCIAIFKDAYFDASKRNCYTFIISVFTLAALNLAVTMVTLWQDGNLSSQVYYLFTSLCFCAVGIVSIVKTVKDKKSEDEV